MKTYKSKYNELLAAAEKHMKALSEYNQDLNDLMTGEYRYHAGVRGMYSDETIIIHSHLRTGAVLIASSGMVNKFYNTEEALKFWSTLSKQPHNLRVLAALERLEGRMAA